MGADAGSLRFHLVTNVLSVTEDLQLPLPTDNVGLALSGTHVGVTLTPSLWPHLSALFNNTQPFGLSLHLVYRC